MKKLYLHMGFHKTASTSFQETCKENIGLLDSQGLSYPLFNTNYIKRKNIANHSIPVYSAFTEFPEEFQFNIKQKVENIIGLNEDYITELENQLSLAKDVIISGEGIADLSISSLTKFKYFIEKYNFAIVPIVVVRSPYEFHCSSIQQSVKGGMRTSLVGFISQINKIKTVKAVFPDTEFIPFRKTCEHKFGPVGYLLEKIGVNLDGIKFIKSNERVSNALVRSQVVINRDSPVIINGKLNENWRNICSLGNGYFESKFWLTEDEMSQVQAAINRENDFFDRNLGEDFKDNKIQFSDDTSVYGELANYFLNEDKALQNKDIDYIRDAAVNLENIDLSLSFNLMTIAHKARPDGPFIKQKLLEYEIALNEKNQNDSSILKKILKKLFHLW